MEEIDTIEIWRDEINGLKTQIERFDHRERPMAFYGSSSIRLWDTMQSDLFPMNPLNLGFGGSTYEDCLYYFPEVFAQLRPNTIVLYGGDNDLANGKLPTAIFADFKALVTLVRKHLPETKIAAISIKPSPSRVAELPEMQETNALIRAHLQRLGGTFIDVYSAMLGPSGRPAEHLFTEDKLHMNTLGYALWASMVRQYLS